MRRRAARPTNPLPASVDMATMQKVLGVILLGVIISACAVGPNYRTPRPDLPPQFTAATGAQSTAGARTGIVDLATWWRSLDDPELNSLVDRAIKSNLDLEIALTRLQQA